MLLELKIENFALVSDIEVPFQEGFNVLTGESGAGKSLIIESLNFVLGARVNKNRFIGKQTARVQGIFDISNSMSEEVDKLIDMGIIENKKENLILIRKLTPSGRNFYYINGQAVTLKIFLNISNDLVDIHSQRDNQYLLNVTNQRKTLDLASGDEISSLLSTLKKIKLEYKDTSKKIEELINFERERNRKIDWLRHEIKEIESANLKLEEDTELENSKNILSNAEKISTLSNSIYNKISSEDGIIDKLNIASKDLIKWCRYDSSLEEYCNTLDSVLESLRDISSVVYDKGVNIEFNPSYLDEIIGRIHKIDLLKSKYGPTILDILNYLKKSYINIKELEDSAHKLDDLIKLKKNLYRQWYEKALEISQIRKTTAKILEKEISSELIDLGMMDCRFYIDINSPKGDISLLNEKEKPEVNIWGFDNIEFKVGLNPGSPEGPLNSIVSGGELSRIMLALKNVFSKFRNYSSLVFDEIDTGIGGATAEIVGKKIQEISRNRQVICITHLPVIASMANTHYQIIKKVKDGKAQTTLIPIKGKDRIKEVVRMLAGENHSEEAIKVAQKMLKGK